MTVPVLIVHWNRPAELAATADAFRRQTVPVRLTVIDNGSAPANADQAAAAVPDADWLRLPTNVGFGPGMNVGLRRWLADPAGGEWAVLAPHDTLPAADCVERVLAAATARPRAGLASAEYGKPVKPGYRLLSGPAEVPARRGDGWEPAAFPNGALMAVRRACLADVGLFDERYFAYLEEYELALRAARRGWECGLVWGAVVVNPDRAGGAGVVGYLLVRNQLRAVRQTHGPAAAAAVTARLLAGSAARRLRGRPNPVDRAGVLGRAVADFWRGRAGPPPADLSNPGAD